MKIESYAFENWHSPKGIIKKIYAGATGLEIGILGASLDTQKMRDHAIQVGGKNLRQLGFHERAKILKALAIYLSERKEQLYKLNYLTGATRKDGWIDIDGGIGTLMVYSSKGRKEMPDGKIYLDGSTEQLSRQGTFLGQHIHVPKQGVAVHINAFNFPVWGMLEKLSQSFLAGMPTIIKPASDTVYLAEACFRMMIESNLLPKGSVQFIAGSTGELLNQLGSQDVVSFTGSKKTAETLKSYTNLIENSVKFISEQDSLNASILGLDAKQGSPEFDLFIKEAVSEMTTKAGQKCTAMRRLIIPSNFVKDVSDALIEALSKVKIGNPENIETEMGSIVSENQKQEILNITSKFSRENKLIFKGVEPEKGAFVSPHLYHSTNALKGGIVHNIEAFGPVATIMNYDDLSQASELIKLGGGSLVSSIFTFDSHFANNIVADIAAWNGRIYINNRESAGEATGHGSPLPHLTHGGPGRAGGGEEQGGIRGVKHYMQRTAIQGSPQILSVIKNQWVKGAPTLQNKTHPFTRTFNELSIGETLWTKSRKVTMEDIEHFANFTGDTFYAHMDEDAAKANPFFPGRVAHGYLLLSFAAGLFVQADPGPVLANTGIESLSFQKPVSPNDDIQVRLTVGRKTKRTDLYGEIKWDVTIFNQNDEQVAEYGLLTMVNYER